MKYSPAVKVTAFFMAVLGLLTAAICGMGIALIEKNNLYSQTPAQRQEQEQNWIASDLAQYYVDRHAAETLGWCSYPLINRIYGETPPYEFELDGEFAISAVVPSSGKRFSVNSLPGPETGLQPVTVTMTPIYPIVTGSEVQNDEEGPFPMMIRENRQIYGGAKMAADAEAVGELLYQSDVVMDTADEKGQYHTVHYWLNFYEGPEYEVSVYFTGAPYRSPSLMLGTVFYPMRYHFAVVLILGLLVAAVSLIYLCFAAGRSAESGELIPAGLNRLPLDLYFLAAVAVIVFLSRPISWYLSDLQYLRGKQDFFGIEMFAAAACGAGISLTAVSALYALAAQLKFPDRYWWNHSLIRTWGGKLRQVTLRLFRGIRTMFSMLPVIWQWLTTAAVLLAFVWISSYYARVHLGSARIFWRLMQGVSLLSVAGTVCYGGYCFGVLVKAVSRMAEGNLDYQIPTRHLTGCFLDFAERLNSLAGAARIAADQRLKSERMKTELITNVSHDIKTPLTSIISFVALLRRPHSEQEHQQYLDILDRQSQRLKKLIDDLMEMSKASTGNVSVELAPLDAAEAVNQALGEFADKLDAAGLEPVFRAPEEQITMLADGRLVWRVLSNVLSNAVKYALPDTRLYLDLYTLQGNAVITLKNISREQLNVDAEELMERFVRGDMARNTEGSGLGLNIARSLVELQHGRMQLTVDGDLFKVTLMFPLCS